MPPKSRTVRVAVPLPPVMIERPFSVRMSRAVFPSATSTKSCSTSRRINEPILFFSNQRADMTVDPPKVRFDGARLLRRHPVLDVVITELINGHFGSRLPFLPDQIVLKVCGCQIGFCGFASFVSRDGAIDAQRFSACGCFVASRAILDHENLATSRPDPGAKACKFAAPDNVLFVSWFEFIHYGLGQSVLGHFVTGST